MVLSLRLHPGCLCPPVTALTAEAVRPQAGALRLRYRLSGTAGVLKLPPSGPPERADGLWQTTCFEAFLRAGDAADYLEFNLSPSGRWAAYRFTAYRTGMQNAPIEAPAIVTAAEDGLFTLEAEFSGLPEGPWRLGLSAVIEDRSGRKSYWALAHPPGQPDFHHEDSFALSLPEGQG